MAIGVAANTGFTWEKMYERFAGIKKTGRDHEVTVRRVSMLSILPSV